MSLEHHRIHSIYTHTHTHTQTQWSFSHTCAPESLSRISPCSNIGLSHTTWADYPDVLFVSGQLGQSLAGNPVCLFLYLYLYLYFDLDLYLSVSVFLSASISVLSLSLSRPSVIPSIHSPPAYPHLLPTCIPPPLPPFLLHVQPGRPLCCASCRRQYFFLSKKPLSP